MTTWRRSSPEALRSLLAGIRETRWSWEPEDVAELCRRMGWTLVDFIAGKIATADADLDVPGHQIIIVFRAGPVGDIKIQITETVSEGGADEDRFIRDAFADAADTGIEIFGEPTSRQHTGPPSVRWRLDDSTVLVENVEVAVLVTWASNRWQDEWDQIAEALA